MNIYAFEREDPGGALIQLTLTLPQRSHYLVEYAFSTLSAHFDCCGWSILLVRQKFHELQQGISIYLYVQAPVWKRSQSPSPTPCKSSWSSHNYILNAFYVSLGTQSLVLSLNLHCFSQIRNGLPTDCLVSSLVFLLPSECSSDSLGDVGDLFLTFLCASSQPVGQCRVVCLAVC